jgi:hypothetical protein
MAAPKVQITKNYRLFQRSTDNRPADEAKHRRLQKSMEKNGFLEAFPIVCRRDTNKHLVVVDGQHRLLFAESLQLPVYYIVTDQDFSIPEINNSSRGWVVYDYAKNFAERGCVDYQEVLDFHELHGIPIGISAALLSGTTGYSNVSNAFVNGSYAVKDREWAHKVATVYSSLVRLNRSLRSTRLIEACMSACRVDAFNGKRLLQNAERCRDKLVPYSTRDAYLDMLEEVYNYGRKQLFGLKAAATMAMRARSAC